MSYNATVCYSRDAVMSYPIVSCLIFFQVAQSENVVSDFQNCADRYVIYDHYNVPSFLLMLWLA